VIVIEGSLTTSLTRLIVENGYAPSIIDRGAGLSVGTGNLIMDHCVVRNNVSGGDAGGLTVSGNFQLLNSAVYNNEAHDDYGGGIYLTGTGSNFEIRNSTISDNSAAINGGVEAI
jgi:hypothetical protein